MWKKCCCEDSYPADDCCPDWCDTRRVKGRFGLAFVAETPCCCPEPIGWQVEFCDTPSKVEQRCKEMVMWANCPPLPRCEPCPPNEVVSPCFPPKCNPCCPITTPCPTLCSSRCRSSCCSRAPSPMRSCCCAANHRCYKNSKPKCRCVSSEDDDYRYESRRRDRRNSGNSENRKNKSRDGRNIDDGSRRRSKGSRVLSNVFDDEIPVKESRNQEDDSVNNRQGMDTYTTLTPESNISSLSSQQVDSSDSTNSPDTKSRDFRRRDGVQNYCSSPQSCLKRRRMYNDCGVDACSNSKPMDCTNSTCEAYKNRINKQTTKNSKRPSVTRPSVAKKASDHASDAEREDNGSDLTDDFQNISPNSSGIGSPNGSRKGSSSGNDLANNAGNNARNDSDIGRGNGANNELENGVNASGNGDNNGSGNSGNNGPGNGPNSGSRNAANNASGNAANNGSTNVAVGAGTVKEGENQNMVSPAGESTSPDANVPNKGTEEIDPSSRPPGYETIEAVATNKFRTRKNEDKSDSSNTSDEYDQQSRKYEGYRTPSSADTASIVFKNYRTDVTGSPFYDNKKPKPQQNHHDVPNAAAQNEQEEWNTNPSYGYTQQPQFNASYQTEYNQQYYNNFDPNAGYNIDRKRSSFLSAKKTISKNYHRSNTYVGVQDTTMPSNAFHQNAPTGRVYAGADENFAPQVYAQSAFDYNMSDNQSSSFYKYDQSKSNDTQAYTKSPHTVSNSNTLFYNQFGSQGSSLPLECGDTVKNTLEIQQQSVRFQRCYDKSSNDEDELLTYYRGKSIVDSVTSPSSDGVFTDFPLSDQIKSQVLQLQDPSICESTNHVDDSIQKKDKLSNWKESHAERNETREKNMRGDAHEDQIKTRLKHRHKIVLGQKKVGFQEQYPLEVGDDLYVAGKKKKSPFEFFKNISRRLGDIFKSVDSDTETFTEPAIFVDGVPISCPREPNSA